MGKYLAGTLACKYTFYRPDPKPLIIFGSQLKADLFTVLDKFVEQAALIDNLWVEKQSYGCLCMILFLQ
jgi:hypothetical protein